ncbi:hypothetical protein PUN28_005472 [Cardiocondyla obscurior]|uniref:Uncharacterized protein n=1 Tax=Cardiocondyla obscurior TaxID=286306 RepID=A0AAW2GGQ3_9HYME
MRTYRERLCATLGCTGTRGWRWRTVRREGGVHPSKLLLGEKFPKESPLNTVPSVLNNVSTRERDGMAPPFIDRRTIRDPR